MAFAHRGAQGADRRGLASTRSSSRAHTTGFDGVRERMRASRPRRPRRAASGVARGRHAALRARCTAQAELRGVRLVDGRSPSTRCGERQRALDPQPGARARQRRPRRCGAHADPRPFRRAGRGRDGRVRDVAARRRAHRRRRRRRRCRRTYGLPGARPAGADGARRWWTPPAAASSTCCSPSAATSWTCCPIRGSSSSALGRVPLRVHQDIVVSSQMLVDPPPGGAVVLLPAATRYEQEGGGTQTTTERRVVVQPRDSGAAPRRGAVRNGRSTSTWRGASTRTAPSA